MSEQQDAPAAELPTRDDAPRWAMADLWEALGFDREGFDAMYVREGDETLWHWLLSQVRLRPLPSKTAAKEGPGDPMIERATAALAALHEVTSVNVEVVPAMSTLDGYGRTMRREPLEATVTVTGRVRP